MYRITFVFLGAMDGFSQVHLGTKMSDRITHTEFRLHLPPDFICLSYPFLNAVLQYKYSKYSETLSSRYLHTYNCFITSILIPCGDQGQVQRWVTLTYFSRSQRLIKEKVYHHDISTLLFVLGPTFILTPVIHMMKLKVKFKNGWYFQGNWLIKGTVCHHDIFALTICIISI